MTTVFVSKEADAVAPAPGPRLIWRLLTSFGLASEHVRAPERAGLASRIETLAATRLRDLRLPPDIMVLYKQSGRTSATLMASNWAAIIGIFVFMNMAFDYWMLPPPLLRPMICMHVTASLLFVLSSQLMQGRRLPGLENLLVVAPCMVTLVLGATLGIMSGSADIFRAHVTMIMVVTYTAVIFTQLDFRGAILMTALSTLITAGFTAAAPLQGLAEKVQIIILTSATMAAIVYGKHIQEMYRLRLFLLQFRDELRSTEAMRRNEQLSSIAYTDRLTDIPNRRFFDEIAETITADPQSVLPLSVCMLDIDHFKNLNDRLGHLQGDRCLRLVAMTIRNHLRHNGDIVARFGGEEFVLLLPNTDGASAREVAERVREAVFSLNHPNPGTAAERVSISIGLAVATMPGPVEALLQEADKALYRAKAGGRNRVWA